jgi:hypothetical protein
MDAEERRAFIAEAKAQRSAAPDGPELTLTERELVRILRREFAAREGGIEQKIVKALPGIATVIHEVRQQLRREFAAKIAGLELRIDAMAHAESKRQVIAEAAERHEHGAVIDLPALGKRDGSRS